LFILHLGSDVIGGVSSNLSAMAFSLP